MILVLNITELRHKFRVGLEHWRQRKEQRQVRLLLQSVSESSGTFCDPEGDEDVSILVLKIW